ncbi:hypothetical protein JCM11641_001087 [Rhodosporidiobolus odoratus]
MVSLAALLVTYVLGGITFIPFCAAAFLAFLFYTSPIVSVPDKTGIPSIAKPPSASPDDAATAEIEDSEPMTVYRAGWLTVRRTYEAQKPETDVTYVSMLASGYRSFLDNRSRDPRRSKPKDKFYVVLKQSTLFLYEGQEMAECWAAVDLVRFEVGIWPEGNSDGELFVKRTAIRLKPKEEKGVEGKGEEEEELPWFIFVQVQSDKEDWYHSLVLASQLPSPTFSTQHSKITSLFSPTDMAHLIDRIDASADLLPMRWFNALLGRVFLAVYRTSTLENYLTGRLVRKLKRVKLPSLLSEVKVKEVNVGSSVPLFSKPMLKELTTEGDASMEVHVDFVGAVRVTIETVATVSLGSRFKPYSVRLVLAVVLRELEGTLLVKMKKPPSGRVWFGFTQMPKLKIDIEPVVSARQIKWSLVTGPIDSKIRELIADSLVLPHMDDLSFFDTRPFEIRGGIYGDCLRKEAEETTPTTAEGGGGGGKEAASEGDEEDLREKMEEDQPVGPGDALPAQGGEKEIEQEIQTGVRKRKSRAHLASPTDLSSNQTADTPLSRIPSQPETKPTPPTTSFSSSSTSAVSTGLAGLSASIASWRESRGHGTASSSVPVSGSVSNSPGPAEEVGTGKKKSWFSTSTSRSSSLCQNPSSSSSVTSPTPTSPTPARTHSGPLVLEDGKEKEEVSARKLREVLERRAESRERDRREEVEREERDDGKQEKPLPLHEPDRAIAGKAMDTGPLAEGVEGTSSRLSGSASSMSSASSLSPISSHTLPTTVEDAELEEGGDDLEEEAPTPTGSSQPSVLPSPTPPRTSSLVSHPAETGKSLLPPPPPLVSSSPSSVSSLNLPSAPPFPPPHALPARRHTPSASVDSHSHSHSHSHRQPFHGTSTSTSTSPAGLLASWRSKAGDKEAIATGVKEAKERLGKLWGGKNSSSDSTSSSVGGLGGSTGTGTGVGGGRVDADGAREEGRSATTVTTPRQSRSSSLSHSPSSAVAFASSQKQGRQHSPSPSFSSSSGTTASSLLSSSPTAAFHPPAASPSTSLTPSIATASLPSRVPKSVSSSSFSSISGSRTGSSREQGAGGGGGYKRANMMAIPGLAGSGRERERERVKGDHLGGGATPSSPTPVTTENESSTLLQPRPPAEAAISPSTSTSTSTGSGDRAPAPAPAPTTEGDPSNQAPVDDRAESALPTNSPSPAARVTPTLKSSGLAAQAQGEGEQSGRGGNEIGGAGEGAGEGEVGEVGIGTKGGREESGPGGTHVTGQVDAVARATADAVQEDGSELDRGSVE